MRKPRLTLQDFELNWQIPRRVELEHKVTRVYIAEYYDSMMLEVYSGRRTYPAILKPLPLHVIVLAAEEELPPLSPLLGIKARRFKVIDEFPIAFGNDDFKLMAFIKSELPA